MNKQTKVITNLTDDNKVTYQNGVTYMRVGNNFADSINVYDGKNMSEGNVSRLGVINFVKKGKPIINRATQSIMYYVDAFVFEPQSETEIPCNTFKHIARYVYDLNQQLKEYGRMKQGGNDIE